VPIPTLPEAPRIVNAVDVDVVVANVAGDDVAKYKFPPALLNVHGLEDDDPSVRAIWGPVEDDTVSDHLGVEVPIPSNVLLLSKWKLVLFDKPVALDQKATLFAAPPERPATHEPLTSRKQPPVSCIPFAKVLVAEVDVTSRAATRKPPVKVDVAVVVAVKFAPTTSPTTESFAYGVLEPKPTLPLPLISKTLVVPLKNPYACSVLASGVLLLAPSLFHEPKETE